MNKSLLNRCTDYDCLFYTARLSSFLLLSQHKTIHQEMTSACSVFFCRVRVKPVILDRLWWCYHMHFLNRLIVSLRKSSDFLCCFLNSSISFIWLPTIISVLYLSHGPKLVILQLLQTTKESDRSLPRPVSQLVLGIHAGSYSNMYWVFWVQLKTLFLTNY